MSYPLDNYELRGQCPYCKKWMDMTWTFTEFTEQEIIKCEFCKNDFVLVVKIFSQIQTFGINVSAQGENVMIDATGDIAELEIISRG